MNFKIISLIILSAVFLYQMLLEIIRFRSAERPIPENVKDVYDAETYKKWKKYSAEKCRLSMLTTIVSFVVSFLLLAVDAYAAVSPANPYGEATYGVTFDEMLEQNGIDLDSWLNK